MYNDKELSEASLYEFFKQCWPYIEGANQYVDNWHIEAIAEHLEALYYRKIKNLIINVPPRIGKSSLCSIVFPAWVWLQNPTERFLYVSHTLDLSRVHSILCRRLIESNWYKGNWGDKYKLVKDQNTKTYFINNFTGYRRATSVGSHNTGHGASMLILDDPNNVQETSLDRQNVIDWYIIEIHNRLNSILNDIRLLIQQRSGENDLTGYLLANHSKDWTLFNLPMRYARSRGCETIVLRDKVFKDPREVDGELLFPKRFPKKEVDNLEKILGPVAFAAQYLGLPVPETGGIIKSTWFQVYNNDVMPRFEYILQSWDTALTANKDSSYSAQTTWGVFIDENGIDNIMLLSMWRGKLEYPELRNMIERLYLDYRDVGANHNPKYTGIEIDEVIIEAKASGMPLIQSLKGLQITATPFIPNKYGDKLERVRLITHFIENGLIWVKGSSNKNVKLPTYVEQFLYNISIFPKGESRDVVDSMTQAFIRLRNKGFLMHKKDVEKMYNFDLDGDTTISRIY